MNKFIKLGFIFLLIFGTCGSFGSTAQAEKATTEGYSISIVKYRLEDPTIVENQLPLDGTKAGEIKDSNGKSLDPLKGISYEITRVSPVQGTTDFEPVIGESAFTTTVTTDDAGLAQVTNLAQGTYRVVEKEHELLKETMEPVILELPLPQRTGEALNDVYLYPKSSVVTPDDPKDDPTKGNLPNTNKSGSNSASGASERLPQTSGNIGSYHSLLLVLSFILIMTLIGFRVMKTKKFDF
ncbi:pilin N-terminal domain-containing protein [Enterococcus sp. DIV0187]|uniref:pilin N-terminal domain-containing protein n=1 Tax=Enterococcus sp. DIV0187 TaxID=2774644 RepID=UPI003F28988E